ncbi:SRPBCC family protein [Nocardiopsis ganjiahuensis]|uniref:SRPBCC family protein n=1 Tax=Nocardiopsis ganjiahuensis TaxID=239984 RepID=UPI0003776367
MTVPGRTESSIVIDAPYDLVWEMTNDVASWPELFTEHESVEILHEEGDTVRFRLTKRPDEHGRVWSWVSERTSDRAAGEVRAHRVETGAFQYMNIHWTYEEVPEGVRMTWRHDFALKPEAPVDDEQMSANLRRNIPVEMGLIKDKVEAVARDRAEEAVT